MKIAVVALGKIGLPLAVQFANKGHHVIGCDVNQKAVDLINAGTEPFPGEANLDEFLKKTIASGHLVATTDTKAAVAQCDAVVVVVPLFVDNDGVPDFGWMDDATKDIAEGLKSGTLISYETTLPVGTTRTRFAPMLEKISGLKAGVDFHLVFSPERVLTGRVFADLRKYPKLVGGVDASSTQAGINFYNAVLDFDDRPDLVEPNGVWDMGSTEASEMAKLAETTYRDVNIGLANQFAIFAEIANIDISKVISASNSQPFSHIHQPGIAVGGHCIPIYPRFYLWNHPEATIVRAAREANAAMPVHAVNMLAQSLISLKDKKVAVLGISYRGGVKESAFSGVFPTVTALKAAGASVLVHDPMYTDKEITHLGFTPYAMGGSIDGVILQADHAEYKKLTSTSFPGVKAVVDGRRIMSADNFPGVNFRVIGAPPR
ncbi:MAG: nucleotide sugar dehydrogenase [Streptomycetaceae bacterium]|nr:MAG: nucleotide sugar dehydrogenase [Streptomycetaceae bacterium]